MPDSPVLTLYRRMRRNEAEAKVEALRKTAAEIGYVIVRADEYNAMKRETRGKRGKRKDAEDAPAEDAPTGDVDAEA